ncbi:hypothetical protein O7602_23900 [Micromonospora sp. WMMD1128]|uniref:hypothetical protein n=1 Tax=Micromonospora sp. WMMD1128 TaxID=3015150 RepID=UPI00248C3D7A|nr:hypothetical protein [Micromonospora sp. WMMD1128]WBB72717.1 hypothetical protein O7602_23900 [Micromonospora sp. WMMD1128]
MTYYKFLGAGRVGPFSGHVWSTDWLETTEVSPCHRGLHACRVPDLPYWLHDELWSIEFDGPVTVVGRKVVGRRARLSARVSEWNPDTSAAFARACVGRTAGHAAAECGDLDDGHLAEAAERLLASPAGGSPPGPGPLTGLRELALRRQETAARAGRQPASLVCGYLADAVEMASTYPAPALGYVAARAAQARRPEPGGDRHDEERRWQADWLVDRLRLTTGD